MSFQQIINKLSCKWKDYSMKYLSMCNHKIQFQYAGITFLLSSRLIWFDLSSVFLEKSRSVILYLQMVGHRTLLTVLMDRMGQRLRQLGREKAIAFWFFNASWSTTQKTSIMEICLLFRRSYSFQRTLTFKQQSMEFLSMAKAVPKNQKSIPCTHPTSILNSKVRCGSILFRFLKQSNKMFGSITSKMPNNAFYSVTLYCGKSFQF